MKWPVPWNPVNPARGNGLRAQLRRELAPGHALYDVPAMALAARADQDDVLFLITEGRVAEVHLTWASGEVEPPWPHATVHASLEDWRVHAEASWAEESRPTE